MDSAAQLHQTATIVGNHGVRAAFDQTLDLVLSHRNRDMREFYRKHPTESAALLGISEFNQLEFVHRRKESSRLVANS